MDEQLSEVGFRCHNSCPDNIVCFVCNENGFSTCLVALVQKGEGEKVVAMFPYGVRLCNRVPKSETIDVVRIGACTNHNQNLDALSNLTKDGIITADKVCKAMKAQ